MKKLLISLVAMMIATVSFAQNQVATLSHGDVVTNYYGASAFQQAMESAEDGDLINLSAGKFYPCDITKALTIRGTGINEDAHTIIVDRPVLYVPVTDDARLTIEGVELNDLAIGDTTTNARIIKCKLGGSLITNNTRFAQYINCDIQNLNIEGDATAQFFGCHIESLGVGNNARADFSHCVVLPTMSYWDCWASWLINCSFFDCIIVNKENKTNNYTLPVSSTCQNCISVGSELDPFTETTGSNNIAGVDMSIFIDSDTHNDLTDEAKARYLGTDGTPVGMYGGKFPYNVTPSYPRITKFNVSSETSSDGKLEVEVVVGN